MSGKEIKVFNNFCKAIFASRDGGLAISVHTTDEFCLFDSNGKRYHGVFHVVENGKVIADSVPIFEVTER